MLSHKLVAVGGDQIRPPPARLSERTKGGWGGKKVDISMPASTIYQHFCRCALVLAFTFTDFDSTRVVDKPHPTPTHRLAESKTFYKFFIHIIPSPADTPLNIFWPIRAMWYVGLRLRHGALKCVGAERG